MMPLQHHQQSAVKHDSKQTRQALTVRAGFCRWRQPGMKPLLIASSNCQEHLFERDAVGGLPHCDVVPGWRALRVMLPAMFQPAVGNSRLSAGSFILQASRHSQKGSRVSFLRICPISPTIPPCHVHTWPQQHLCVDSPAPTHIYTLVHILGHTLQSYCSCLLPGPHPLPGYPQEP